MLHASTLEPVLTPHSFAEGMPAVFLQHCPKGCLERPSIAIRITNFAGVGFVLSDSRCFLSMHERIAEHLQGIPCFVQPRVSRNSRIARS